MRDLHRRKGCVDQFKHHAEEKVTPQAQADYFYMSATSELCGEKQAKACMLTLVDVEQAYISALLVAKKGNEPFATRFVASFLDRVRCDEVRVRHDNEPSLVQLVDKVKAEEDDAGAHHQG